MVVRVKTNQKDNIMQIIHTSPSEITKIEKNGMFDDCLFFSGSEYSMCARGPLYVYSLEIDDEKVIAARELYNEEVIADIANVLNVDEDAAERMLDGRDNAFDHGLTGEDDWWIQAKQGECAKLMGYEACEAWDEQGTVYIVPMLGRENELSLERVDNA